MAKAPVVKWGSIGIGRISFTKEIAMSKKVWNLMYVVGNPAMFTRVTSNADNPMSRADALAAAETVASNGGGWRVWVEHHTKAERIFESQAEKDHKAQPQTY